MIMKLMVEAILYHTYWAINSVAVSCITTIYLRQSPSTCQRCINTFIPSLNNIPISQYSLQLIVNMKLFYLALPILAHCGEIVWNGNIKSSMTIDHFDQCTHSKRQ